MKDGAAETAGTEGGDSLTQGQGEQHLHQNPHTFQTHTLARKSEVVL